MDELIRKIALAKVLIDNGMCRVGQRLDPRSAVDAQLSTAAGRAIVLSDAVGALCRQGRPNEALPLLRQLTEEAAAMRWLAEGAGEEGAAALAKEREEATWDALWPEARLRRRAEAGGLSEEVSSVIGLCREFSLGGPVTLPWAHVFPGAQREPLKPGAALEPAVRMMGHVLNALDRRWPGEFPGAEQVWAR
ncbi:MAG TPA: hypothetical protein DCM05_13950 [Elusimicrobia bacterium]|nr:hypothetical protein [Elusimicrobiota bacterium]